MITVATWNTEWREPNSRDGATIRDRLQKHAPDIVCLTEAHDSFLEQWGGFVVEGETNWGGPTYGTRRKVMLWSRKRWRSVDTIGSPDLPPGRFVKAETETIFGPVTVVGVVVPFHMANVRSGRRDRKMWEDHHRYLTALPQVIADLPSRSVVLGDFNQRIPSSWVPRHLQKMLTNTFEPMTIATTELHEPNGRLLVDHIAHGSGLIAAKAHAISNITEKDSHISDHLGVVVSLDLPQQDDL